MGSFLRDEIERRLMDLRFENSELYRPTAEEAANGDAFLAMIGLTERKGTIFDEEALFEGTSAIMMRQYS